MFNSILNAAAVAIDSLILDVFIILGVVVAAALVIYFLCEAVSAIVNKTKKTGYKDDMPRFDDKKSKKNDNVFVTDYKLDAEDEKTEEKEEETVDHIVLVDENKLVDVDEEKAEEEKSDAEAEMSEEEKQNAERRAYLEARRQELIRRMQAELSDNDEEENTEETSAEENEETEEKEEVETPVAEEQEVEEKTEEPEIEETEVEENKDVEETVAATETTEEVDALEEERKALSAEKERYELMVKELEEAKRALAEQTKEPAEVVAPVATNTVGLSLDELKSRLADAEEKLKTTEKEFKQCKKEYIPLRKVWDTHEKDEKKLRRKEALVAKQKVLLYGVNNYADIDQEKAQKLAEDLDLLDGLKLSVQHCEEVMKDNEERYPLLEKMYGVLKLRNDELRDDIAKYTAEIARLEAEQNSNATENADNE